VYKAKFRKYLLFVNMILKILRTAPKKIHMEPQTPTTPAVTLPTETSQLMP